jgi:hypothetical protein
MEKQTQKANVKKNLKTEKKIKRLLGMSPVLKYSFQLTFILQNI